VQVLKINNLTFLKSRSINFEIKAEEIIGLSGASGSGKTLLLRALADLDQHEGDVLLDEISQQKTAAHLWRKKVAMLPAETSWWFDTVEEHFIEHEGEKLQTDLAALGFAKQCTQWSIARLSSGEKQRLGLLRLIQNKPQVLLLDEPTANLDKNNTQLFENFLQQYLTENHACAIWVSHDADQLQRISHRQFVIEKGVLKNVD